MVLYLWATISIKKELRVYLRGFSAGKSDVVNLQCLLVKPKIKQLF